MKIFLLILAGSGILRNIIGVLTKDEIHERIANLLWIGTWVVAFLIILNRATFN